MCSKMNIQECLKKLAIYKYVLGKRWSYVNSSFDIMNACVLLESTV